MDAAAVDLDALAARLLAAGCVFAEDEAALLAEAASDAAALDALAARRTTGEPLETILGWVGFAGMRLAVGPGVFVPRQRTARLARAVARIAAGLAAPVVVEACCGVAPVAAVVLARVPGAEVVAIDADPAVLPFAAANAAGARVLAGEGLDLPADLRGRVDVIAAVPPYVPDGQRGLMPHDTFANEPASALLGGPEGLDVVRALLDAAPGWLAPGGRILLELHRDQASAAAAIARAAGLVPRRRALAADGQTALLDAARPAR